ncbi:MAG: GDSL family lipase [Burkholderiaceae bacterium]|nr:MAG: GDSL family lipase [Burkholderiaceae bacterium]
MAANWMRRSLVAAACASAALLAACGSSTVESAVSPDRVIAFGDGISDVGQKGSAYTVNDGTVLNWTSQFATYYGKTVKPVSAGGLSYAQGNARIKATPDAAGNASTPTITAQIDSFLSGKSFTKNDFVTISGGTSDLIAGMAAVRAGTLSAADYVAASRQAGVDLAAQVRRLVAAGATHVVVAGVYDLSKSPWGVAIGQQTLLADASARFNEGLLVSIVDLGASVQYVDLAYYMNLYVNSPSGYGFENANTAVCTSVDAGNGIGTGTGQVNSSLCTTSTLLAGANQDKYVFADGVYLTPSAQRQFGNYAHDKVRVRW